MIKSDVPSLELPSTMIISYLKVVTESNSRIFSKRGSMFSSSLKVGMTIDSPDCVDSFNY